MPLNFKKYIAAAIFLMACLTANGQENQYSLQQYTTSNGLPENLVSGMSIDKKGFLWIGVMGSGVCRFDGLNFKVYNILNTALKTNMIHSVYQLPNGNMKVVGQSTWYNISGNYTITPDSLMSADRWMAYNSESFFLYGSLVKNPNWPTVVGQPGIPSRIGVNESIILNDRECYAAIGSKVYYLNNSSHILSELKAPAQPATTEFWKAHFILGGLFVANIKNRMLTYRRGVLQPQMRFSKEAKTLMDKVWQGAGNCFGTNNNAFLVSGNSLYRLQLNKDSIWTTFLLEDSALDDNIITTIKQDVTSGNIYIGTSQGVFVLRPVSIRNMLMEKSTSYNTSMVTDVIQLDNGDLLNNTQYFNIYTKKTKLLDNPLDFATLLKCSDGTLLYRSNDTLIWSDQSMRHVYLRRLISTFKSDFREDRLHGFIWGVFEDALWKLYKNGKVERMVGIDKCKRLVQATANTILVDALNGIFIYDIAKNQISAHPIYPNINTYIFYQTKDSAVWIGTMGRGFYRYKNEKFTKMPLDNKRRLEGAMNFYEDAKGFLWIGTNNGLVQCLKSDLDNYALDSTKAPYYYFYDQYDGLSQSEFMGVPSPYALDSHGMLVYGKVYGVTYFSPLAMRPLTTSGAILIEALSVDDSIIAISDHISLQPNFNRLRVSAVLPYFGNRDNIALEYNISGLNNTWYRVDEKGAISIDRLPSGTYKLMVRSQKGFGPNNYQYSSFSFRVRPYFYQTWWFYTLILIMVILCTALFFLSKTRALLRGKLLLEKQVETRTEKLNESLENLNIIMEDLFKSEQKFYNANEVKEQAMAIIFHDLKAPVRYLNMAATGFRANVENLSRLEINQFSETFKQSTQEINEFVEGLLQWLVLQQEDFRATYAQIPILPVFREIASLYKEISALNGNVIIIGADLENVSVNTDRDIFKIIIRNLVDNAVKNTKGGQILLSAAQVDGISTITVADNGKGMDKATLEKLLTDKVDIGKALKTTSLGFGFVKRFLKLIHGSVQIESEIGIGTRVFVSLANN